MSVIELICDVVLDALKDMCFILPVLFLTYLAMELIEHFAGDRTLNIIKKSKKLGPLFGAVLGVIPECGIAGGIANLYVAGVISVGAFVAAILSTSDEMLAVLISAGMFRVLLPFVAFKLVYGCICGFAADAVNRFWKKSFAKRGLEAGKEGSICEVCEREHCLCGHHHHHEGEEHDGHEHHGEHGHEGHGDCHGKVWLAALVHTLKIAVIIFAVSVILGLTVELLGKERIQALPFNMPVAGELIAALFGLIPNCSVSVILSNFYAEGIIDPGPLMAGLLSNGGVGLLVFYRMNRGEHKWRKALTVTLTLYVFAVIGGLLALLVF